MSTFLTVFRFVESKEDVFFFEYPLCVMGLLPVKVTQPNLL